MSTGLARSRGHRRRRRARSRLLNVSVGVAAIALVALAVARPLLQDGGRPEARTAAAAAVSAGPAGDLTVTGVDGGSQSKAEKKASGPSKYTDTKAMAYFTSRWTDKAAGRISDIRTTGRYLRIYTNLPESADNSKTAITLCKRGLEYLAVLGEPDPVVFVHSEFGENGNPVLANILGHDDKDCRVTHPRPE